MKLNVFIVSVLYWTPISKCSSVLEHHKLECRASRFKRNVKSPTGDNLSKEKSRMNYENCNSDNSEVLMEKFRKHGGHRTVDIFSDEDYHSQTRRYYGQKNKYRQSKVDSAELEGRKMFQSMNNPRIVSLIDSESPSHRTYNKHFQTNKEKENHLSLDISDSKRSKWKKNHGPVIGLLSDEGEYDNIRSNVRTNEHKTVLYTSKITTQRNFRTTVKLRQFANKDQLFAHFSLRFPSAEIDGPRTPRTTTERGTVPSQQNIQRTTPFDYFCDSEQFESIPTTEKIECLPYVSGEDLFEYYLRNISQGRTTDGIITRKRIRYSRTTTTERDLGLYDSVTSAPGYFDDSLKRLVDDYVGSGVINSSEVMRVRARDAQWLKEAEEREARGEPNPTDGFDMSAW